VKIKTVKIHPLTSLEFLWIGKRNDRASLLYPPAIQVQYTVKRILKNMVKNGILTIDGNKRWAKYSIK